MFNFLDPKLLPKVICKSPAMDNYEAENLINPNSAIRARGFIAYTVIKPPVEIEFEFICPIDIAYISLNTTIGNQRCTGIEIFAKSTQYMSISKALFDKSGVVFCDSRKFTKEHPPEPLLNDDSKALFFFKKDTIRYFTNTTNIKVVIFRTNHTVPCLASIQIIGKPSKSCSQSTIETINKLMGLIKYKNYQESQEINEEKFDIPSDFIDDLTCEIMALPMTLPSGKTVDKETLEKYIENEASFGRKPGDPFTGLKFTDNRRPILNVALKSRIDMFLLQHSQNPITYNLKRTVGHTLSSYDNHKRTKLLTKCINCENCNVLYSLPCSHYYCRTCLINNKEKISCKYCVREFEKHEIVRCYT